MGPKVRVRTVPVLNKIVSERSPLSEGGGKSTIVSTKKWEKGEIGKGEKKGNLVHCP